MSVVKSEVNLDNAAPKPHLYITVIHEVLNAISLVRETDRLSLTLVREGWATNQGTNNREKSEYHSKVLRAAAE